MLVSNNLDLYIFKVQLVIKISAFLMCQNYLEVNVKKNLNNILLVIMFQTKILLVPSFF